MKTSHLAPIFILVCLTSAGRAAFPRYRVTDMRPLMPYGGSINAMNNLGDMVGRTNESTYRMQLWKGQNHNYSAIGGIPETNFLPSTMNNSGVVGGGSSHYPALWRESTGWELLPRDGWMGGGVGDTAWRVSKYDESLQIVAGYNEVNVGSNQTSSQACRWERVNGVWTKIMSPTNGPNHMYFANDIDADGNIVGTGSFGTPFGSVTYWGKNSTSISALDYPSANWTAGGKAGFDASGRIIIGAGRQIGSGPNEGAVFVWDTPTASARSYPLDILPGYGLQYCEINRQGWVASNAVADASGNSIAVLWSREYGFSRVDNLLEPGTPAMNFGLIKDLNDNGSMVLAGRYVSGGGWFYARLDPVPEPTSLLLLTPGLAWIVIRWRKVGAGH